MPSQHDWERLRTALDGELLLIRAGDEVSRLRYPRRIGSAGPWAGVAAATVADVARTIAFGRRHSLRISPRSGGHCFVGRSSAGDIVLDVASLNSVTVAGEGATVAAGTRLADLDDALERQGLAVPTGCGRTVGIAGLTLGGGLGLLGRRYGLTCDRLLGAQVVLADGRIVDCDGDRYSDLYWALRGSGGGQLGVVVSLRFATVPSPQVLCFRLSWPTPGATGAIGAWQDWAPSGPRELSADLRVQVDPRTGEPHVQLLGTLMLDTSGPTAAQGNLILDDIIGRVGGSPQTDVRRVVPYHDAKRYLTSEAVHADQADTSNDVTEFSKSEFFRQPLPAQAIAELLARLTEAPRNGQARQLNFTPWGGAYNAVPTDHTAFAHRDELFLLEHVVDTDPRVSASAANGRRWLDRSWTATRPWGSGRVYPNFPAPTSRTGPTPTTRTTTPASSPSNTATTRSTTSPSGKPSAPTRPAAVPRRPHAPSGSGTDRDPRARRSRTRDPAQLGVFSLCRTLSRLRNSSVKTCRSWSLSIAPLRAVRPPAAMR